MLRWFDMKKASEPPDPNVANPASGDDVTDDPLAAIETGHQRSHRQIYSVSRSVLLPRVTLKNTTSPAEGCARSGGGINPLFQDVCEIASTKPQASSKKLDRLSRHSSPQSGGKSNSSGYGGSHGGSVDPLYVEQHKLREDSARILEQNPAYVKSIKVPLRNCKNTSGSGSSGSGTLTTIPEGRVDLPIPKPIWPLDDRRLLLHQYDSIVDDALLLYTSLNFHPEKSKCLESYIDLSVKDLLLDLLNSINATLEGKSDAAPEDMLKIVNEKIRLKLDLLKNSTEEEMRKLCINLSNSRKVNSVLRAVSNSSSSGNSSQGFLEWSSGRVRTSSSDTEDFYQIPSGSSSSGFSDSLKDQSSNALPVFVHEDLANVPNGLRNAMIYGTLCRAKNLDNKLLIEKHKVAATVPKKSLLRAVNDNKPSVWEQYYGVKAVEEGEVKYVQKPTDVPLFPRGRPEADFTLDVPRSELLSKKMKDDKKWRCRCRLLTSFLGLIFFLLSVMAVSLMLTRGKRMFGSMV